MRDWNPTTPRRMCFSHSPGRGRTPELEELGETLDTERRELMLGRALGLTKLYNQVHDPAVTDPAIVRLRELHEQIDHAVLAAYGWDDLDPEVGHHRTKIGIRWTVSPQSALRAVGPVAGREPPSSRAAADDRSVSQRLAVAVTARLYGRRGGELDGGQCRAPTSGTPGSLERVRRAGRAGACWSGTCSALGRPD